MRSRLLIAFVALASLAACGDISNEELQALAVLPDSRLAVTPPADDGQALTADYGAQSDALGEPSVVRQANATAVVLNLYAAQVVTELSRVTSLRPTSRVDHRLVWGPFLVRGRFFAKVTLARDATAKCASEASANDDGRPRFRVTVELAATRAGPFDAAITGVIHGEDFDHSCGELAFDKGVDKRFGGLARAHDPATVTLAWSRDDDAHSLDFQLAYADAEDGELVDGVDYHFERGLVDGHHHFAFVAPVNLATGPALERLHAAVQWTGEKAEAGRTDYALDGGDEPARETGHACWNGLRRYRDDWTGTAGDPSSCDGFAALPAP